MLQRAGLQTACQHSTDELYTTLLGSGRGHVPPSHQTAWLSLSELLDAPLPVPARCQPTHPCPPSLGTLTLSRTQVPRQQRCAQPAAHRRRVLSWQAAAAELAGSC